jgi:DNA anti-recombination protein RmuC
VEESLWRRLSNVISSFRAENTRLMESFRAVNTTLADGITATLTANFKERIQQFYDRLTKKFQAETCRLKDELASEFQGKISTFSQDISNVRDETDRKLEKVTDDVQSISSSINGRVNAHVGDTRKKTELIHREVEAGKKKQFSKFTSIQLELIVV